MKRFLAAAFFLAVTGATMTAQAAVPPDVAAALKQQFADMKKQSAGLLSTEGELKIDGDSIIYPQMKILVQDKLSYWTVPPIRLNFTGSAQGGVVPFSLSLPDSLRQTHINGTLLRAVTLTGQNIGGDWSQKDNTIARIDGKLASVTWNDTVYETTTTAQNIALQAKSQFVTGDQTGDKAGDKANIIFHTQADNFTRMPQNFANGLMPSKLSMTGQIKSLPKALIVFGALMPIPGLEATLAKMGTQIDIDNVNAVTNNGATLSGNGFFKAAGEGSPLPVSGRMNLTWENLQQVLTSLQQGFSKGGGDRAQTAQSMVLLMALQGLGKAENQKTSYTVDLTPEGQVILNGQDVTAMFVGPNSLLRFFQPKPKQPTVPADAPPVKGQGTI